MKRTKKTNATLPLLLVVILIIVSILSVTFFVMRVDKYEKYAADERIRRIALNNADAVRSSVNGYINILITVSNMLQIYDDLKSNEIINQLAKVSKTEGFLRVSIYFPDEMNYTSDGRVFKKSSLGGYEAIMKGEITVSNVVDTLFENIPSVSIHVPIYGKDGKTRAALGCVLKTETLIQELSTNLYDGEGYYYIIDENGRYVAYDQRATSDKSRNNYFIDTKYIEFEDGYSQEQIDIAFKEHTEVTSTFVYENTPVYVHYSPIKINKWVMMVVVPLEKINSQSRVNIQYAMDMLIIIVLVLIIMAGYIYFSQRKARIKAELDEQYFRVLAQQSGKMLFEWDFGTNEITSTNNFEIFFDPDTLIKSVADEEKASEKIHPDDIQIFRDIFSRTLLGENTTGAKFRIKNEEDEYHWCVLHATVVKHKNNRPYKAIGTLESIDEQVKKEEALFAASQTDSLTKLKNKMASEILINDILLNSKENSVHALICFDLDNFKNINDSFGHLYGDEVLIEISSKVKNLFRSTDILGRFGGDEFVALIKDVPDSDESFIRERVILLGDNIRNVYQKGEVKHLVSASIGIALYPRDGKTYEELYEKADYASYIAKKSGKDRFIYFDDYKELY